MNQFLLTYSTWVVVATPRVNPSCLHTMSASSLFQSSSQTNPHWSAWNISKYPLYVLAPRNLTLCPDGGEGCTTGSFDWPCLGSCNLNDILSSSSNWMLLRGVLFWALQFAFDGKSQTLLLGLNSVPGAQSWIVDRPKEQNGILILLLFGIYYPI